MNRLEELTSHLFRLIHLARSAKMKRALTATEPEPTLNFWCLIYGNQLDIAVLEWCKVFGSDGEATHWKKIVFPADHNQFRDELFTLLGITADEWGIYWSEMKGYRDNLVAHHIEMKKIPNYPILDIALKSSFFTTNTSSKSCACSVKRDIRTISKPTVQPLRSKRARSLIKHLPQRQQ